MKYGNQNAHGQIAVDLETKESWFLGQEWREEQKLTVPYFWYLGCLWFFYITDDSLKNIFMGAAFS